MRRRWYTVLLVAFFVVCFLHARPVSSNGNDLPESGPYIDKLVYVVIPDRVERFNALLSGAVDMVLSFLNSDELYSQGLEWAMETSDISLHQGLRNGYGRITFNCREYPLNISGFRRAFAYAFDKSGAVNELNWLAQEHDSLVPFANPFCIEDELSWNWYLDEADSGNTLLDELNFTINSVTGVRDAPNGELFSINIGFLGTTENQEIAILAKEALENLFVRVAIQDPFDYINMFLDECDFTDYDVSWLASEFGSAFVNEVGINLSGFSNSTYDMWGEQLLQSPSYESVLQAASEMQKILHYEVPSLVAYQNHYVQVYRSDRFKDHVADLDRHLTGYWTMLNIKRMDGTLGGTLVVAVDQVPDSFNFFAAESEISKTIFDKMHLGLYTRSPDLIQACPQLAKEMTIETHEDNPNVPSGHTRYTIELKNDLLWTDGVTVTANDVAFTFNYILESGVYGNPVTEDLTDLMTVYAPNPFRIIFEFTSESYWNFERFAYDYILPKHLLEDLSFEDWDSWNLDIMDVEATCGPFVFSDYEINEFYEFTYNLEWGPDRYHGDPASDVSLSPAADFVSLFPSFSVTWDLIWEPDSYYRAPEFHYTILLDGEHYLSRTWHFDYSTYYDPDTIIINVNEPYLAQGTHNFTIIVETLYHGLESDTVIVTIQVSMFQVTPVIGFVIPFGILGIVMLSKRIVGQKYTKISPGIA